MVNDQPVLHENPFPDNEGTFRYIYPRDNSFNGPFPTREAAMTDWLKREQYD